MMTVKRGRKRLVHRTSIDDIPNSPLACFGGASLVKLPISGKVFRNSRTLTVWLPPGYDTVERHTVATPSYSLNVL